MDIFLILCSMSVGFYAVLLVALYRDGRKRRHKRVDLFRQMAFDDGADSPGLEAVELVDHRRSKFARGLHWMPVTRVEWKPSAGAASKPTRKPVKIATPVVVERIKSA